MREHVRQKVSVSTKMFSRYVWPHIQNRDWYGCGRGRLEAVELVATDEFAHDLDHYAGIDYWHVVEESGMRGIASRVQGHDRDDAAAYASFTVRKHLPSGRSTEWQKRRNAIFGDEGWSYPEFTVQAYVDTEGLLAAYMVRSEDLYRFATSTYRGAVWTSRKNRNDGNVFAAFWVDWLKAEGVDVRCFEREVGPVRSCREQRQPVTDDLPF